MESYGFLFLTDLRTFKQFQELTFCSYWIIPFLLEKMLSGLFKNSFPESFTLMFFYLKRSNNGILIEV